MKVNTLTIVSRKTSGKNKHINCSSTPMLKMHKNFALLTVVQPKSVFLRRCMFQISTKHTYIRFPQKRVSQISFHNFWFICIIKLNLKSIIKRKLKILLNLKFWTFLTLNNFCFFPGGGGEKVQRNLCLLSIIVYYLSIIYCLQNDIRN